MAKIKKEYLEDRFNSVSGLVLTTGGWSLVGGVYQQVILNSLIAVNTIVNVIPNNASIATVKSADFLPSTVSADGGVTVYASKLPTANITVTINIFK